MRILLDTHIVYWWFYDTKRLSNAAFGVLDGAEELFVSSATIWEIAIKVRIGKMRVDVDRLIGQIRARGIRELPVNYTHAKRVANLSLHHNDPFDRLLIAQALSEPLHLLTADTQLKPYSDLVICV